MFINSLREDDDIIYIDQACFPLEQFNNDVQRSLKGRGRIGETEGHSGVLELTGVAHK